MSKPVGAQVEVISEFGRVYLYTHNHADTVLMAVHDALSLRKRWDDADYLARIIFCRMIPQEEWLLDTGYGIGTEYYLDTQVLVTVDTVHSRISIHSTSDKRVRTFTLTEFVEGFYKQAKL